MSSQKVIVQLGYHQKALMTIKVSYVMFALVISILVSLCFIAFMT